jgi:hypothetical protein
MIEHDNNSPTSVVGGRTVRTVLAHSHEAGYDHHQLTVLM